MFDFELFAQPVSADNPCGPDLDLEGDTQYLNFFAAAEAKLPMSYFEVKDANGELKRFDPKSIDAEALFEAAKPLVSRTRDLRLIVLLTKISILNRDLASFIRCLETISELLERQWENVHPQGEDGDFAYRGVTVESIDALPTVIIPLQFLPLVENRRYGTINYRAFQIASGEIAPSDGEAALDLSAIERIVNDADLGHLRALDADVARLVTAINRIKTVWSEKSISGQAPGLDRLSTAAGSIAAWIRQAVSRRDPNSVEASAAPEAIAGEEGVDSNPSGPGGGARVTSAAGAAAALDAVAGYFTRSEPSNPALLLVRQAQQMVGKSFVEVMRILVPAHIETAVIHIGRERSFDLQIMQMADLLGGGEALPSEEVEPQSVVFTAENRGQALVLLDHVAGFFRQSEPSSPVPFLIDKAREMAQRDFISLLRDVLPEGALNTPDNQAR